MKPIHLNLASRPYRDYRPVYAVVVVMSLLTAYLMLTNIETWYRYTHETRNTRAKITDLEIQTRQERQRQDIARRKLDAINLQMLDAQTRFINAKLAERAFSWSTLLDELESVIARDVRLVSITPAFGPDGTIGLNLQMQSKSGDGMITTINRMNADPQFANTFPSQEEAMEHGYAFQLTSTYRPPPVHTSATIRSAR